MMMTKASSSCQNLLLQTGGEGERDGGEREEEGRRGESSCGVL